MPQLRGHNTARYARIAGKQQALWCAWDRRGLDVGDKSHDVIPRLDEGSLHVIAEAEIRSEPLRNTITVLQEERVIPITEEPGVRSILLHGADLAGNEIGHRISC